ncbi:MAG: hopanoid biosynthesis associated radical SAM protein HpnJ [Planctomycetes bacterium RIFCSPHIGHO2_12_FULL_52_36]|nr:MAG: hopanoid biosynthesis associated radical SAM protein HpnJ [Planctomycetes bacterium RIFCSPHIGHO2_12_FULL_52_36]
MRVALLNPPSYADFDGGAGSRYQATREVTSFWYPTWLCYPAGMIEGSKVIDAPAEHLTLEETLGRLKGYDLVAIYTSAASFNKDVQTAGSIKAQNSKALVAVVGPHPSAVPEECLRASNHIDFVCRREFDYTIKEVAEGKGLKDVSGISYRKNGQIIHNPDRKPINDLDALPFVVETYKRDLNIHNYQIPYLKRPYVSIYTGRGCPAQCIFCLWPQTFTGNTYRVRSPQNVVEEVQLAVKYFPEANEIFFDDDTFTANRSRVHEICKGLKHLGITWSTTSRVTTDPETLKVMKDSGLRLLVVGYESGSQKILNNVKKGTTLEQAREFTKNCKKLGIQIHGAFILGLPEETKETIEESIRFAREMNPDTIQVSLASPYPGTKFYEMCQERGYLVEENLVMDRGYQNCCVRYPTLSHEEVFRAVERFYKKFYYRPGFIFKILKKILFDREERKRILREGKEFKAFLARRKGLVKGKKC